LSKAIAGKGALAEYSDRMLIDFRPHGSKHILESIVQVCHLRMKSDAVYAIQISI
jgi:hypothetical protein